MTMHMLGPYMTTTNTRKRKSKKSQKQKQADIAHDKWLRKMGAHPDQRKGDKCYGSTTGSNPVSVGSTPTSSAIKKAVP